MNAAPLCLSGVKPAEIHAQKEIQPYCFMMPNRDFYLCNRSRQRMDCCPQANTKGISGKHLLVIHRTDMCHQIVKQGLITFGKYFMRDYTNETTCCRGKAFLVLLFTPFIFSCSTYNFSDPLPVDKTNIYEFPPDWQGKWAYDDAHSVIIKRNYAAIIIKEYSHVVQGIWPKKKETGEMFYPGGGSYMGMYRVVMDSSNKPVDTIANFLVNGNHIFSIMDDGQLEKGYHYTLVKDTFIVNKTDTVIIDLGHNAFLRKVGSNLYVLNVLNQVIGKENLWWQVVLFEKKGDNTIDTWLSSYKLSKEPSMFYEKYSDYYFNSNWKTADILKLMHQGAFEKCDPLKRQAEN